MGDTGVLGGKAAGRQGAKGMGQGIEKIHAAEHQQQSLEYGHAEIDVPEIFGGFGNPRGDFVDRRPRGFGLDQLQAANPEQGQDGYREHDNPHPPEPVRQRAPVRE